MSYIIFQIITSSYGFDIYLRMVRGSLTADPFKYQPLRRGEFYVTTVYIPIMHTVGNMKTPCITTIGYHQFVHTTFRAVTKMSREVTG